MNTLTNFTYKIITWNIQFCIDRNRGKNEWMNEWMKPLYWINTPFCIQGKITINDLLKKLQK